MCVNQQSNQGRGGGRGGTYHRHAHRLLARRMTHATMLASIF